MAELRPFPFDALVRHMFRELDAHQRIFHLPANKFVTGSAAHDLSVSFQGHRPATPFGAAAGPQTQMAQNIVLSWLAGGRILELKTVQILDELKIPRPCIDMETVGYNVEWSQELKLEQSLEEYVKGSMLVEMLRASGRLELPPGRERVVYDMSVGYDLRGIQSPRVRAFMDGMMDASAIVERLRAQIPDEYRHLRDLDFQTKLSDTLTLSTFHGCPPEEIEQIIDFLLREVGLHCIVKLNPTLLGAERARHLLHDVMGYEDVRIPDTAFERDATWAQAVGFVERLRETATARGLGFGVKLTNTLIVHNHRGFFPASEKEMYLSGPPLHVLSMNLVAQFRERFGGSLPISFSAGIDRQNFADAVALGLVPITVCSDLLKPGGYGRATTYFKRLLSRMDELGATHVDDYVLRAFGHGQAALDAVPELDPEARAAAVAALGAGGDLREALTPEAYRRWVEAARVLNTATYVAQATADPRYGQTQNAKGPKKVDSHLVLFDCLTCDKCLPVCPNDANFRLAIPPGSIATSKLVRESGAWREVEGEPLTLAQKHQIGNFADYCNECGNCDVFCPEYDGPYVMKPRFFGTLEDWRELTHLDGFFFERAEGAAGVRAWGRFTGAEFEALLPADGGTLAELSGVGFAVRFDPADPPGTASGEASAEVDLTYYRILDALRTALVEGDEVTYAGSLLAAPAPPRS